MIELIIYLVVLCVVVGVAWWILDYVPVPEPLNKVAKIVIMVVALILVIYLLLGLSHGIPKLP